MTSKSRIAQENLAELEKRSAPFEKQLEEAGKFIGFDFEHAAGAGNGDSKKRKRSKESAVHGREEWLLRWLLKKLQAPKDDSARKCPSSWILLTFLIQVVPITTCARILVERKFTPILMQTLEEIEQTIVGGGPLEKDVVADTESVDKSAKKASKKRKRSGELISDHEAPTVSLADLLPAIYSSVQFMLKATTAEADIKQKGRSAAFSAEYMKTVLRAGGEEAAKILGLWLFLSHRMLHIFSPPEGIDLATWLSPFVDIWELRSAGTEDAMQFSLHCSDHLLSLLQETKRQNSRMSLWAPGLEQLAARNIIIPAKIATAENEESDLLSSLTKLSVIRDSANAPLLFEIAVLSLQPHGTRRRSQDEAWLQTVFTVLKEALPAHRPEQNGEALQGMLSCAAKHRVSFELSLLRSITIESAIPEGSTNWRLLSTIIRLDANTLIIQEGERNLLGEVLHRITVAGTASTWPELYDEVVREAVVPLMREFAKVRDLSGFIRHWYTQLVAFEKLRIKTSGHEYHSKEIFSAWEADALQEGLVQLLEPSLTVQQILQLLEWLSAEVKVNPDAVCVVLQAVCHSIDSYELVDTVGLKPYHIMFDDGVFDTLDDRYKWRAWKILAQLVSWNGIEHLDGISRLWSEGASPFGHFPSNRVSKEVGDNFEKSAIRFETLESVRFLCIASKFARKESSMEKFARVATLSAIESVANDTGKFMKDLKLGKADSSSQVCGETQNSLVRGNAWTICAFLHCILAEYPEVLRVMSESKENLLNTLLINAFYLASIARDAPTARKKLLGSNPEAFSEVWSSLMQHDFKDSDRPWLGRVFEVVLSNQSHIGNPLCDTTETETNDTAVQSLLRLPIDVFPRAIRERVMKGWLPTTSPENPERFTIESTALNPDVLSLKIKIMNRPTFYEGMKYTDLVKMTDPIANSNSADITIILGLYRELARRTLLQLTVNLDQARERIYITDALEHFRKQNKHPKLESLHKCKNGWNFASVTLSEVLLTALAAKKDTLQELDIISRDDLASLTTSFTDYLLSSLHYSIERAKKRSTHNHRLIISIVDALEALGLDGVKLNELAEKIFGFVASLDATEKGLGERLENFLDLYSRDEDGEVVRVKLGGNVETIYGRQSILHKVQGLAKGKDTDDKLELLQTLCENSSSTSLSPDTLLSAHHLIKLCKDSRESSDEKDNNLFDLSSAYSELCSRLWKTDNTLQFSLVAETLEDMLRTKPRAVTQWNIDSTLGAISIMCSRSAPSLPPTQAGNIYLHLCRLLQAILTSHRLKLQGHFHLVLQSTQALLRCLFTPLRHSTSKSKSSTFAPPPWLSPSSPLRPKHAEAFTRLLTLICNPSVSSVTRSRHNNLSSETEKAKRMAGQHMQFLLTAYIQLQLEMKMSGEVREKLVPGLYALFDATTLELRQAINEGLDGSGRAVFGGLYRDWKKNGKWEGS